MLGFSAEACRQCKLLGRRDREALTGERSSPVCRLPGGRCQNPVPELEILEARALMVLQGVCRLRGWEHTILPVTGQKVRTGLSTSCAESVCRGLGIEWSEDLMDLLATAADVLLEQDAARAARG